MSEYNLADYVAIPSLMILILAYIYSKNRDKVNLKVSYRKSKEFDIEIENLGKVYDPSTGEGGNNVAKIYEVTVLNIGNVDAYIKNIYLESIKNERYKAKSSVKISPQHEGLMIVDIENKNLNAIAPKASKTFDIYISNNQKLHEIKQAIAIDQINKTWKIKKVS